MKAVHRGNKKIKRTDKRIRYDDWERQARFTAEGRGKERGRKELVCGQYIGLVCWLRLRVHNQCVVYTHSLPRKWSLNLFLKV